MNVKRDCPGGEDKHEQAIRRIILKDEPERYRSGSFGFINFQSAFTL